MALLRNLLRTPGFALFAILSLALGIGANTALFSIYDQFILKTLPAAADPERLVVFHSEGANTGSMSKDNYESVFSYPMFADLEKQLAPSFDVLYARTGGMASLSGLGEPLVGGMELVSGNYFRGLGLQPALGRLISSEDEKSSGAQSVVVLSHAYWTQHYGARAGVLNQKLLVNQHPLEIIGVAPAGFTGLVAGSHPQVFLPLHLREIVNPGEREFDNRRAAFLNVFGRLRAGVSVTQAAAQAAPPYRAILEGELREIKSPSEKFRHNFASKKLDLLPGGQGINVLKRRYETQLLFLLGMVALILVMACANVANLFTVRAIGRRREMAIRVSLGATRVSLVRQLVTESLVLSLAGAAAATTIGYALQRGLAHFVESIRPGLDWRALLYNFALSLIAALLFGLVPAFQASNPDLAITLKEEGTSVSSTTSQGRLRQWLAFAQLALAMTLVVTAGLFARTLFNLQSVNIGFRTDHVLTFNVQPLLNGYSPERTQNLYRDILDRLQALPEVERAAMVTLLPLTGSNMMSNVTLEGYTPAPDESLDVNLNFTSPGYFAVLGTHVLAGRDFSNADNDKAVKAAIVNAAFARKWLRGASPIGKHIGFGAGSGTKLDMEIVGLVEDQKTDDLRGAAREFVYLPSSQLKFNFGSTFVVRTRGDETALGNTVRGVIRSLDPNLPVQGMKSLEAQKTEVMGDDRLNSLLTAAFGVLATLLAALGLYGVLAFTVAQRTKEIGIRMALGGDTPGIIRLVLLAVARPVAAGILIGLLGAWAVGRWAGSQLFGVPAFDPLVAAATVLLLLFVALAAAILPSLRAARTDPMIALRQ